MAFRDYNSGIDGTCMDCKDRYPACHDKCEKYRQARESWEAQKQMINEARQKARLYDDYKRKKIGRERRKGENSGKSYSYSNKAY